MNNVYVVAWKESLLYNQQPVERTCAMIVAVEFIGVCSSRGHHSFWLCLEQRFFTSSPVSLVVFQL